MQTRQLLTPFLALLLPTALPLAAQDAPGYAGRPFVQVARGNAPDPTAGFISGFGRAQVAGDAVVLIPLAGPSAAGIFSGRGGPLTRLAGPGTAAAEDTLQMFHDGFARGSGPGGTFAFAAGPARADAVYRTDGTSFTRLLPPGSPLPNSGGKAANVVGEPFLVGDALAVIAAHRPDTGPDDFRGVYRVRDGALVTVADTATELPDGFGIPDGFSSQVGFDGTTLAFWATRGPFTETEGMFVQDGTGTLSLVARAGDAFPDGGTIDGFISPPFVSAGMVYFYAFDSAGQTRLLGTSKSGAGLTVFARDGDSTPEGTPLQGLGQFGLAVEGDTLFFPALSGTGAGLYAIQDGQLQTLIAPGTIVAGLRPTALVLQDVDADTLVIDVASGANRRIAANLAAPAVPVIITSPGNLTVAEGTRLDLRVTALGDGPLAYRWQWSSPTGLVERATTDTLVIDAAAAADVGYYSVRVTNTLGSATSASFLVNVETAPVIFSELTGADIESGDPLQLRVTALGGQPVRYLWLKDGEPVTSDSPLAGIFVRTSSTEADAGRYQAVMTNAWGQVTSAEVVVSVRPPGPNPMFDGGRFVTLLDPQTSVPGTDPATPFSTDAIGENSGRIQDSRILFVAGPADNPRGTVQAWEDGALRTVLQAPAPLPNGLGTAAEFSLLEASPGSPLALRGFQLLNDFQQPVGIYRAGPAGLEVIADVTLEVPGQPGTLFPPFFGGAAQSGDRTAFTTTIAGKPGLFLAEAGTLRRLLPADQDLPVVGRDSIQFQNLALEGDTVVLVAATAGLAKMVALQVTPSGEVTPLIAKEDPIPDTPDTIRSFGAARVQDGAVYLGVFNAAFSSSILEIRDGRIRRLAGQGMPVGTLGTLQSIESSGLAVGGGKVFLAARLSTPTGNLQGIVAAGPEGIEPVLFTTKLDSRRVTNAFVVGADANRVLIGVFLTGGTRALYANVGPADNPAPRLEFTRAEPATLHLAVPIGTQLEAAAALGGPWSPLAGTGEVAVSTDGATRFFRLRRE